MTYDPQASVALAKTRVGYHEGVNNYNPFSSWQGLNPYNPWCASFTCWAAVEGGGYRFPTNNTFGYKGEAYVPTMKQRAQEEGLWRPRSWRARPGDFVLFDWGNDGLLDHVEEVIYDDGIMILDVGGNTGNMCAFRTRDRGSVAGFYALSDSPQAKPVIDAQVLAVLKKLHDWEHSFGLPDTPDGLHGKLKVGMTNWRVSVLVDLLLAKGLVPHKSNTYNLMVRSGMHHLKVARGITPADGMQCGPTAAHALLNPA